MQLNGVGPVFRAGEPIANVRYQIQITQEFSVVRGFGGSAETLPGLKNKSGRLTVLTGNIPVGETLSLHLEDDTTWIFFANPVDPLGTVFRAVSTVE